MEKNWNWAKELDDHKTIENIPERMRRLETKHWVGVAMAALVFVAGYMVLTLAPEQNLKVHLYGVFLVICALFSVTFITLHTGLCRAMLWILWDSHNRLKAEMDKMNAADL